MTRARILLAEDEPHIASILQHQLSTAGFQVLHAVDGEAALDAAYVEAPDLAILDVRIPRTDGLKVAAILRAVESTRDLPIIILTGSTFPQDEAVGHGIGVDFYMTKPYVFRELLANVETCLSRRPAAPSRAPVEALRPEWSTAMTGIVTRSRKIISILDRLRQASEVGMSVLLMGETGVGKSLVARAFHAAGPRSRGPFMEIECPTLAESLIESELFGHEKGSFTGAENMKKGKLELAHGGTLFLDEIADLSLHAQARLLGFLENKQLVRVGGSRPIPVDAQLVFATNRELEDGVRRGTFREDLYFRISELRITIPPLRERREDVAKLATQFIEEANVHMGRHVVGVSRTAVARLLRHDWPGNVRELRNVIRQAMAYAQTGELWVEHMATFSGSDGGPPSEGAPASMQEMERRHIESVLAYTAWNKSRAAAILGITRGTLDRKIRQHGMAPPRA